VLKAGIPLLELTDVSYQLGGRKILDAITWSVGKGENWAILGPNGAGKTTLLKIVCGYLWPNAGGEVRRKGRNDADLGKLRREIGWVTSALVSDIPRRERVLDTIVSGKYAQMGLWALPNERPTRADFRAAEAHLQELRCADLSERTFGSLSQGEQQKVLICRALMAAPYLLILDEPCVGLDPGNREVFLSDLLALGRKDESPSLIYVTHHPEEILPVFTHCLIIKNGRTVAQGPTAASLTARTMEEIYGVSFRLIKKHGRYWPVAVDRTQ
jgi:iron complex transport system ATP-binding protein